jgi:hypothetical protein
LDYLDFDVHSENIIVLVSNVENEVSALHPGYGDVGRTTVGIKQKSELGNRSTKPYFREQSDANGNHVRAQ